jgi:hypothetical protein
MENQFSFENTLKIFGQINKALYGVELPNKHYQDKLDMDRAGDLEELKKDEFYDR